MLLEQRSHFLRSHLEGAIAIDKPYRLLTIKITLGCYTSTQSCWQPIAHRSSACRRQPRARLSKINQLACPHLVLTHASYPNSVLRCFIRQLLDHPLRRETAIGRNIFLTSVIRWIIVTQRVEQIPPIAQIHSAFSFLQSLNFWNQIVQNLRHIAHNRNVWLAVLADLSRINIDMNHARTRSKLRQLTGYAV